MKPKCPDCAIGTACQIVDQCYPDYSMFVPKGGNMDKFKPSQMDIDALESMRTRKEGYNHKGEKIIVESIGIRSNYSYKVNTCFRYTDIFTFEKPIEIPPKGTIVEIYRESWRPVYSMGEMLDNALVVSYESTYQTTASYSKWRIPE